MVVLRERLVESVQLNHVGPVSKVVFSIGSNGNMARISSL